MDRTVRDQITRLEQRLGELTSELMEKKFTLPERNRIRRSVPSWRSAITAKRSN